MNNMYHITADKQKRKYGYCSNIIYFLKEVYEWNKWIVICMIAEVVAQVFASYLGTLLPATLVTGLEKKGTLLEVMLPLFILVIFMMICNIINSSIQNYQEQQSDFINSHFMRKFVHKIMDVDYETLENKNFKPILDNAWATARFSRVVNAATDEIVVILSCVSAVILYGVIILQNSLWILLLVILSVGVNLYLLSVARKMHAKYFDKISKFAKGEEYITAQSMDSAAGKDIRIYNMLDFILKKYDQNLENIGSLYGKIHNWYLFRDIAGAILTFMRDGFAYGFLAYELVNGNIKASTFVFLLGVIATFSAYFEALLRIVMNMNSVNTSLSYFREFMDIKTMWKTEDGVGKEKVEAFKKQGVKLELKDVSYTYEGNEDTTIKHMNLCIHAGEKLALIGLNGAGKTTLVKLICGFYFPEEGQILLNDIPMQEYTKEEYTSLVSVLFQETTLLPVTIDENIMSGQKLDEDRLTEVLELSGFTDKYKSLPQKGQTKLVKKLEAEAVDFSGGEKQKLLFARALYKNAPLVILDEPTAALDPIAENELYIHFGKAMEHRTAIYISHRLSSTRFCDRIVLLEHGQIREEGTHESLLAAKGRYAQLFEMQSQYYKEEEKRKERSAVLGDTYVEMQKGGVFHE